MNPLHPSTLSSLSAVKNRKRKAPDRNVYVSMKIPPKRLYFTPPTHRQNWSLPEGIIYYMAKNPRSATVCEKLAKSCKYFHAINPVIVCSELIYVGHRDNEDEEIDLWKIEKDGEQKIIDLKSSSTKFWITSKLACDLDDVDGISINQNLISSVVPNIIRCEAYGLYLRRQNISFDEYTLLASNILRADSLKTTVKDEDGIVAFEKLFESAAKLKFLLWCFNDDDTSVSTETVKNLLKTSHFSTMRYFGLLNTPPTFDLDTWFSYVKRNKLTNFNIDFSPVLPEAYQNRLEEIVDEIISTQNHEYKPPIIRFHGLDQEKLDKLREISMTYRSRIF